MTTLREKLQARAERKAYEKSPGEFEGPHNDRHYFKGGHADTHEMIEELIDALDIIEQETGTPYALIAAVAKAKFQAWLEEGEKK